MKIKEKIKNFIDDVKIVALLIFLIVKFYLFKRKLKKEEKNGS